MPTILRMRVPANSAVALASLLLAAAAAAQDPPPGPSGGPPFPLPPGAAPAPASDERPAAREVSLTTADRMQIAATFWPAKEEGGPGVVLLHMYGGDRGAWRPVVEHFAARDIAVLAIDLRGHGGSAKQSGGKVDLAPRVQKRDPKLFAAMHHDAFAAVKWLATEGRCAAARIALVGASVGASVAIDAARQHPSDVAAVLCMSPGENYLGLDTMAHVKALAPATPLALLVHRDEIDAGAQKIGDAHLGTHVVVYDDPAPEGAVGDEAWAHGTRMFGRLPLVEQTVASFVAARTGSTTEDVVLDGVVDDGEGADPWSRARDVARPGSDGPLRAFRVGQRVLFGGTAPVGIQGLRFEVQSGAGKDTGNVPFPMAGPPQVVAFDLAAGRPAWTWGGMASVPNLPGTQKLFGKTWPVVRVVQRGDMRTFEGEWIVPALGDPAASRVLLVVVFDAAVHPRPTGGTVEAHPDVVVEVPAR